VFNEVVIFLNNSTIYGTIQGVVYLPFDKKILNKWRSKKDERQDVILRFLNDNGFSLTNTEGSHFTFKHPKLGEVVSLFPGYAHEALKSGVLVVVIHDNKVYSPYLKRIVKACELIEEYETVEKRQKENMQQ
jgi:predicted RNA binding protein YcfA (HicA-like mRNA interferase family)